MIWNLIVKIIFDFLTYGIFLYSVMLLLSYLFIGIYSIGETKKHIRKNGFTDYRILATSVHAPTVSILAPAFNEGLNIVENVRSLLSIYYVNLEVIIINDGSMDDSLEQLINSYELEKIDFFINEQLPTKKIRGIYKSRNAIYHKLIVVDKENGGKADALNVGINISSNKYLVCIDVDCVLEQDALLKMVKPFLEQTNKRIIATGGVVRIANSCIIEEGRLVKVNLANDYLPQIQILEYIRAFILGRMAWARLDGLMLISGAFGAFDKEIVIKSGGYNHKTVGEDMELVVRMRRYMEERGEEYLVTYIPDPLCWTEAPSTYNVLGRQRNRWLRGTYETLSFHRIMFFNPKYGLLGMLSYPYWFFFELCAPVIEFFGFIFFLFLAFFGILNWGFFAAYFIFIVCFGYLYSCFAILMEVITFNQYKRRIDILRLMLTGLTEPFFFHPFVVWSGIKGFIDLIKKKNAWGEMTRKGLSKKSETQTTPVKNHLSLEISTPTKNSEPEQVALKFEKQVPTSLLESKIIPAINRVVTFIAESFIYFLGRATVFFFLIILARIYDIGLNYFQHGKPPFFDKVILFGLVNDIAIFFQISIILYFFFAIFYFINKKLANVIFIIVALIFLIIQVSLSQYFVTTLVPLGADLWTYSMADIQLTIGASGGIDLSVIVSFSVLLISGISAFIFLPKKICIKGIKSFFIFLVCTVAFFTNISVYSNKWLPGQEYSNSLAGNKSWYFYTKSYQFFFPPTAVTDIYSTYHSSEVNASKDEKSLTTVDYIDEKNYPFLHDSDSSADVLSPFFNMDSSPPNIVILLLEGLGRAFSNKGAYLGNFTPFIDSLAGKSLYWENFLSEGGRTFAVLPSLLGSLPFAKNGFNELGESMPKHLTLINLLQYNGYKSSFYYGGDSHFDNMDLFLKKSNINSIYDEKSFPSEYTKMPSQNGFSWGYGDKELFRNYFEKNLIDQQPYLRIALSVSTHNPFLINEQQRYLDKFEERMTTIGFKEKEKVQKRLYKYQFASVLFLDDAVKDFINQYQLKPEFKRTVFLITGDHRMPEIPTNTKIDRYHVPLIIYSPLLKRTAKFSSISTHMDITPSLLAWMKKSYGISIPSTVSWIGTGLDTSRKFRNIHAYPIMQTKNDLVDFVMGNYLLNGDDLYQINPNMDLTPINNEDKKKRLQAGFNKFLAKNNQFLSNPASIIPDSLLQKYLIKKP